MTQAFGVGAGVLSALLLLGCEAELLGSAGVGEDGSESGSGSGGDGDSDSGLPPAGPGAPVGGWDDDGNWVAAQFGEDIVYSPISRLTRDQYSASIIQAFGTEFVTPELPANEHTGLKREADAPPLGDYDVYTGAAINIGGQLAATLTAACDFMIDPVGCTQTHLGPALRTLYRGIVTQADIDNLSSVVSEAVTRTNDATNAVTHGVARSLLEPKFLYRLEEGLGAPDENGGIPVSAHEFASRLSFLAWESPPDGQLLDLADAGTLTSVDVAQLQAARTLEDVRARDMIWHFVRSWLQLPDATTVTEPLKLAMLEETRRFVEYVLIDERAPFSDLFTADYSFINAELAAFYGVPAPAADWDVVTFPAETKRNGILTHGSFLASNSAHTRDVSWIFRGKIVFENMFCGEMSPPPKGAADAVVESRLTAPSCKGCHTAVDPMGMFFDQFDENGALMENVPTPGTVALGSDIDQDYPDVRDFLEAISTSAAFEHCFVKLWFQHALGRELTAVDQTSFDRALAALREKGSVRQMLEAIISTPAFATIYPQPEEMICQ